MVTDEGIVGGIVKWKLGGAAVKFLSKLCSEPGVECSSLGSVPVAKTGKRGQDVLDLLYEVPFGQNVPCVITMTQETRNSIISKFYMNAVQLAEYHGRDTPEKTKSEIYSHANRKFSKAIHEIGFVKNMETDEGIVQYILLRDNWNRHARCSAIGAGKRRFGIKRDIILMGRWDRGEIKDCDLLLLT